MGALRTCTAIRCHSMSREQA
ncbi:MULTISPECIES: CxxxxCH/CxxCH domain-containing protein [unclassified Pseudomonas]|uniref:CxxxxCH/CxxCH domain-containing protein n=1 Tax=Ectopseudomonas khazarica TaxID=2502979 RepID=A0ABW7MA35_9GAMM